MKQTEIAANLRQYLQNPELVAGWVTPQAVMLKNGTLAYTKYFRTPNGGLILRSALGEESGKPHKESIPGLFARFDAGERYIPPALPAQSVTSQVVFYGVATVPPEMEEALRQAGAEVSDYDYTARCFYLRASADAEQNLRKFAPEHHIVAFPRSEEIIDNWLPDVSVMAIDQLVTERAYNKFWVYSDQNDGRLSTGSSAELDMRLEQLEEIDQRLKTLQSAGVDEEAGQEDCSSPTQK